MWRCGLAIMPGSYLRHTPPTSDLDFFFFIFVTLLAWSCLCMHVFAFVFGISGAKSRKYWVCWIALELHFLSLCYGHTHLGMFCIRNSLICCFCCKQRIWEALNHRNQYCPLIGWDETDYVTWITSYWPQTDVLLEEMVQLWHTLEKLKINVCAWFCI